MARCHGPSETFSSGRAEVAQACPVHLLYEMRVGETGSVSDSQSKLRVPVAVCFSRILSSRLPCSGQKDEGSAGVEPCRGRSDTVSVAEKPLEQQAGAST